MISCNVTSREPTDIAGNVSETMTSSISRKSDVEHHLDHIRLEFRRMQQLIDRLGCDKRELEQLTPGCSKHKVLNDLNDIDLLQMVSSTVMHLEQHGSLRNPEASLPSNINDSQNYCTASDEPLHVQTSANRSILPEGNSGSSEICVRSFDNMSLLKEHCSGASKSQASCRVSVSKEQSSGPKKLTYAQSQLSTMNRYTAARESLPSFEGSKRRSVEEAGKNDKTESLIVERKERAIQNRRQDRLHHFYKIQDDCGGVITSESLQKFIVADGGEQVDMSLLNHTLELIAEKSRTAQGEFNPDSQILDFEGFMFALDTKDANWAPDAGLDVRDCFLTVLQQTLRDTMAARLRPPSFHGGLMTALDISSILVILLNTLAIGFQSGSVGDDTVWDILELTFFAFYCCEAVLKIYWYGWGGFMNGNDRLWNRLDLLLLLLSTIDLVMQRVLESSDGGGQLQLLKIMRLARLARLVRVMRFKLFKELKVMILGLFSGLRALIWAVILLLLLIYIGGIVMVSIADADDSEYNTLDKAMFTLFRCFTDGCAAYDGTPLTERLREEHGWLFFVAWILTTMVVTVGIFNLIMAVFIDNVTKSQQQRKQKELGESADAIETDLKLLITKFLTDPKSQHDNLYLKSPSLSAAAWNKLSKLTDVGKARDLATKQKLANTYFQILKDDAVTISRDVFQMWLEDVEFMATLEDADVDVSARAELFDILDVDMGGELSADELVTGLMKLRGDVSKGDIVAIMLQVRHLTHQLEDLTDKLDGGSAGNAEI
eukprot:TRINITY_DN3255_c0_g1_i4.p1 TRINITY_DN3255_c0_g1~~TRINITY_DN3255_c0_g1_i4.p1  ORF type:complete len:774 (-),score=119.20 TRINITY_DN3255_c0_g1_i4:201-2522(-)